MQLTTHMPTPAGILSDFARLILMLRDRPDSRDEAKELFRRFAEALAGVEHVLGVSATGLRWDKVEIPIGQGDHGALQDHLRTMGIGEIRFPHGLMTSTLVSLIRTLAAPPGTYGSFDHLIARLDAAGCGMVSVLPPAAPPVPAPAPIEPLPGSNPPVEPPSPRLSAPGPRSSGSRSTKPEDDGHIAELGLGAISEARAGMIHFVSRDAGASGSASDVAEQLSQESAESVSPDLLNRAIAAAEAAAGKREWRELLEAAHALVQLEVKADPTAHHRGIGIALRRMLPRSVLEQLAKLATRGTQRAEAVAVLRRMGADGAEVLLSALVECEDAGERRAYFNAVKEMKESGELMVNMLTHDQWFVVRNVAVLCGEMQVEKAVPALIKAVAHDDERVRRAAAGALARIGGSHALDPLRRALKDASPGVRLDLAKQLDGRRNRNLGLTLSLAAEQEKISDVQGEMYKALGRIATPEALGALRKAAEPGGRLLNRKPLSTRLAAVAGLHEAGPAGANFLKELVEDGDREVRAAVEKALQTLWE